MSIIQILEGHNLSLRSSVKMFLEFNTTDVLIDSVSSNHLDVAGTSGVSTVSGDLGYVMRQDQYLFLNDSRFSVDQEMMIGFWLYPVNPGMVVETPPTIEPLRISLMDYGNDNPSLNPTIIGDKLFVLYEETNQDGTNVLNLHMNNSGYTAKTESYIAGVWHHFLIAYNGKKSSIKIIIDGRNSNLIDGGNVPTHLYSTVADYYINRKIIEGSYDVANNQGYIGDVFVMNEVFSSTNDLERFVRKIANKSTEWALDEENWFTEYYNQGIYIPQDPTTISSTSFINDMTYLYISNTKGQIRRGSPLFWEVRRLFSQSSEIDILNKNVRGNNVISISGCLEIGGSVVRF